MRKRRWCCYWGLSGEKSRECLLGVEVSSSHPGADELRYVFVAPAPNPWYLSVPDPRVMVADSVLQDSVGRQKERQDEEDTPGSYIGVSAVTSPSGCRYWPLDICKAL